MNPTQQTILNYIRKYITNHGYSPSIRDICNDCGVSSTSIVSYHLAALESAGLIAQEPGKARSIRLIDGTDERQKREQAAALLPELWRVIGEGGREMVRLSEPELAEEIERAF